MVERQEPTVKHYLLTEYNLDYSAFTDQSYICDEEWHTYRNKIFEDYCIPSVESQSNQNFEWAIFFNEDKRKKYQLFLNRIQNKVNNIIFFFVSPTESHVDLFSQYISSKNIEGYLLTTRMDNDDCISTNFVESIHKKFFELNSAGKADDLIINVGNGYQYEFVFPFRKAMIYDYDFSPFVTHVYKLNGNIETVLNHPHHLWENHSVSVELSSEENWIQLIHGKNLANRVLSLKLLPVINDRRFPVIKKAPKNNYFFGLIFYPIQIMYTIYQRIIDKIRRVMKLKTKY